MTAQTAAQRNQSYRARRKAKLERLAVLEGAMSDLLAACENEVLESTTDFIVILREARKALGDVG